MATFTKILDNDSDGELEIELQNIAYKYGFSPKILKVQQTDIEIHVTMEYKGECLANIYGDDPNKNSLHGQNPL